MRRHVCNVLSNGLSSGLGRKSNGRRRPMARLMLAVGPVAGALLAFGGRAFATTYTWDSSGTSPNAPVDGSGTWSTSNPNWASSGTDSNWTNALTNFAIIGDNGAAGTITVATGITAGSVQFNATSTGDYTLNGGTIFSPFFYVNYAGVPGSFNGPTIDSTIVGTSGFSFTGNPSSGTGVGTLILGGSNTYTGGTFITSGLLVVNSNLALGAGNALTLGPNYGATPLTSVSTVSGTFTLVNPNISTSAGQIFINTPNVTVGLMTVANNTTVASVLTIGNGDTLNVAGGMLIGSPTLTYTTSSTTYTLTQQSALTVNGTGGTLMVSGGNIIVGPAANNGPSTNLADTLTLTGLNTFTYNNAAGTFGIGIGERAKGIVDLASALSSTGGTATNTITANAILIGTSGTAVANSGSYLGLGAGNNILNIANLIVGGGKSGGSMGFATTLGSVTIGGTGGTDLTNIGVAIYNGGGNPNSPTCTLTFAGHSATISAGNVIVAEFSGSTAGSPTGILSFDTGTFNANSLIISDDISGGSTTPGTLTGTFNLGTSSTSTGVLTIGSSTTPGTFLLGDMTNSSKAGNAAQATFNLNGGTANIFANIEAIQSTTDGNQLNATLNLNNGTLNMEGHAIGTGAGATEAPNNQLQINLVPNSNNVLTIEDLGGIGFNGNINGDQITSGFVNNLSGTVILVSSGTHPGYTGITQPTGNSDTEIGGGSPLNNSQLQLGGAAFTYASGLGTTTIGGLIQGGTLSTTDLGGSPVNITIGVVGGTFGGTITGPGSVTMAGTSATVQVIQGGNNYTGTTSVNSGTFQLEGGSLYNGVGAGTVNVAGGTLAGTGNVNGSVSVTSGALNADLSGPNSPQLQFNSLTINGGTLDVTFSGTGGNNQLGQIDVPGQVTLTSGSVQFLLGGTALDSGTYSILDSNDPLSIGGGFLLNVPEVVSGTTYTAESSNTDPGQGLSADTLYLIVSGAPGNLIWTGATNTTWDTVATNLNWNDTTTNQNPSKFHPFDVVTFADINSNTSQTVNVDAQVIPGTVFFTNTNDAYTLSGTGGITGATGLYVSGGGTVTLKINNTYVGDTDVTQGMLVIGTGGVIQDTNVNILQGNAELSVAAGGTLLAPNININQGTFAVASGGVITSSANIAGTIATIVFGGNATINTIQADNQSTLLLAGTLTVSGGGAVSGAIVNLNSGVGSLTVAGSTLILNGSNTYSGTTTINSGATLQVDEGQNSGSINPASNVVDNGTLAFGRNDNPTIGNAISGTGVLVQQGSGTLSLSGNNSYSGGTDIFNGSIQVNPGANLGSTLGPVVLGTPQNTTQPNANGSVGNLIINTNVSVGAFSATTSNATNGDTLSIAQGNTLTVNGGFTVGAVNPSTNLADTYNLTLTGTGGGTLIVNAGAAGFIDGQPSNNSAGKDLTVIDFSGLNSLVINTTGTFGIGDGANDRAIMTLASTQVNSTLPSNSITAGEIDVGNTQGNNDPSASNLYLGSGTNTLDANNIFVGLGKTGGTISFNPNSSGGSLTIAGSSGGTSVANLVLGNATAASEGAGRFSELLLTGAFVNAQVGTLVIGENTGNTTNQANGTLTFDTGTFNAQSVTMAIDNGGSSADGPTAELQIGGPNPNTTATGVFNVGSINAPGTFVLGDFTNTSGTVPTAATATATVVVNGGTLNVYGNIVNGSTSGTTIADLTLAGGGVLNMEGNSIIGPGITASLAPASSDTPTLENLGGGGIDGAGLTMNGPGTLMLAGNNTFSGSTTIASGEILVGSAGGLSSESALVMTGGQLDLNGNSTSAGGLSGAGGVITNNSSSSAGTLTIGGGASSTFAGSFVDGSNGQALNITYAGSGVLSLSGSSSSTNGVFTIDSGTVNVDGSLASGGNVAVSGGTLGGIGSVGTVTESSGAINPGDSIGATGTLTVNSLTVHGGSLQFDVHGSTPDVISDNNGATFSGGSVVVTPQGSLSAGSYNLLTTSSGISGAPTFAPVFVRGETSTVSKIGNDIVLTVTGTQTPASLTWKGNIGSPNGTWDTHTTANWTGADGLFYSLDNVTFDNTASNTNVGISGNVDPGSMTINSGNYIFTGAGSIVGMATLADNDTGTVVLDTNNIFSGGTTAAAGTLQLGQASDTANLSPLGSGSVATTGTTINFASSKTITVPGQITGSGSVEVSSGMAVLGFTSNTYSGGTTISGGSLQVSGPAADTGQSGLGTGNVTVNAGGTLIAGSVDAFGYGTLAPQLININGGTVTDAATGAFRASLPNISFTGSGGTIANVAGNTGDVHGNFSFNGVNGPETVTVNLTNSASTALISATVGVEQPTTINLESGNLLVRGPLINYGVQPVTVTGTGGSLILDSNSTFSGGMTISQGTVQVGTASDTGPLLSPLGGGAVVNESTILFASSQTTTATNVISGTGTVLISSGTVDLTGANTFTGGLTVNNSTTLEVSGTGGSTGLGIGTVNVAGTLIGESGDAFGYNTLDTLTGTVTLTTAPLNINVSSGGVILNGSVGGNRITLPSLTFNGPGTLTNTVANTGDSNGNFSFEGAAQSTSATITTTNTTTPALISATVVSFESPTTFNITAANTSGGPDLLVSSSLHSYGTFTYTLTKTGSGVMMFTGSNTYNGSTAIVQGTLLVDNTAGSGTGTGPVTVAGGASLGGTGSISGGVSIANGGILTVAGGTPLTLGGSLTLASGSILDYSAAVAGTTSPGLASTLLNGITASATTVNVTVPAGNSFSGTETFDVLGYASGSSDPYADFTLGTLPSGDSGQLVDNSSGDQIDLSLTAGASTLYWNNGNGGTGNGTSWDLTNQNWNPSAAGTGTPTTYTNGSAVNFSDTNNAHYAVTLNTGVTPASTTFSNSTGNYTLSGTGGIGGTGSLTVSGSGTVTMSTTNTYSGGTKVNSGDLVLASPSALPVNQALTIGVAGTSTGAVTMVSTTSVGTFAVNGLTVNSGSTLNVEANEVLIKYGATDPIATIQGYLSDGYHAGWSGGEISSSTVATLNAAHGHLYGIGYIDGALPPVNYSGAVPPSGTIEVLPTISGDATLSGTINFYDFQVVLSNFGKSNQSWDQGDFDYASTVDFFDFQDVLSNFGATSSALTSAEFATLNNFAAAHGAQIVDNPGVGLSLTSVPEPASMGLMMAAGMGLLARRRRRQAK